mgnify:CR=1 FL=1
MHEVDLGVGSFRVCLWMSVLLCAYNFSNVERSVGVCMRICMFTYVFT